MSSSMLRLVAMCATLLGMLAGAAAIAATPAPMIVRPLCTSALATRAAETATAGNVHDLTVVVTRASGPACVVANFPQVAFASGDGQPSPLPASRLSLGQSATVGEGHTAAFLLRYTTASAPPGAEPTCPLTVLLDGIPSTSGPVANASCAAIAEIGVSSFENGTTPPIDATAPLPTGTPGPAGNSACRAEDLVLRDAGSASSVAGSRQTFALQNKGLAACRLSGAVGVQLLDAAGNALPLIVAPRNAIPVMLTLPRGHEASFSLGFVTAAGDGTACPASDRIAVLISGGSPPIVLPAHLAPCTDGTHALTISNLRIGVPLETP